MIAIGTKLLEVRGGKMFLDEKHVKLTDVSKEITGYESVTPDGIFTQNASASFNFTDPTYTAKVNFGAPVNWKKLSDEELAEFITRREYAVHKQSIKDANQTVEFAGVHLTIGRLSVHCPAATVLSKHLTGADYCDNLGVFSTDEDVTFEANGQFKDFRFGVLGLTIGERETLNEIRRRIDAVSEWVDSCYPEAPGIVIISVGM